jgi:hypothetical protein
MHEGDAHGGFAAVLAGCRDKKFFAHRIDPRPEKIIKFSNPYHYHQLIKTKKSITVADKINFQSMHP